MGLAGCCICAPCDVEIPHKMLHWCILIIVLISEIYMIYWNFKRSLHIINLTCINMFEGGQSSLDAEFNVLVLRLEYACQLGQYHGCWCPGSLYHQVISSLQRYIYVRYSSPCNPWGRIYHQVSNIRITLVGNKIVDHSDVVGASPVGAAPTTSSFST